MLRFLHGYIPDMWPGLVRRGLIDDTSGVKFHQVVDTPPHLLFNTLAREGGTLHEIIREASRPFYLDRLQGGWWFHEYDYDLSLLRHYRELLGENMLGLQMHEWASNMHNDWARITSGLQPGDSLTDPAAILRAVTLDCHTPGVRKPFLESATAREYAAMTPPETCEEALAQYDRLFADRQRAYDGLLLPTDSYYMAPRQEIALGARALMPEIGAQLSLVRWQIALTRGMARAYGIKWGAYYEPWGGSPFGCAYYKRDFINEWSVSGPVSGVWPTVRFTPTSGSSRALQKRLYLYALLSGAQFMSEEWGSSNTFYDWQDFELTPYGLIKRDFLRFAADHPSLGGVHTPCALVVPREFEIFDLFFLDGTTDRYLDFPIESESRRMQFEHIRAVLTALLGGVPRNGGPETRVLTDSPWGDVFDIVYEDVPEAALKKYDLLIDLSLDARLTRLHPALSGRILDSREPDRLTHGLADRLTPLLPCRVEGDILWLVNKLDGEWALGLFNNRGVVRTYEEGEHLLPEADAVVRIETDGALSPVLPEKDVSLSRTETGWICTVPAGQAVVLRLRA